MSERQQKFQLGALDLTLTRALTAQDVADMIALKAKGTDADFWEKYFQLIDTLWKCASPSEPTLTREQVRRNFLGEDDIARAVAALAELYRTAEVS